MPSKLPTLKRTKEIRKLVRDRVILAIEEELQGSGSLMGEANAQLTNDAEEAVAENEMKFIVRLLREAIL